MITSLKLGGKEKDENPPSVIKVYILSAINSKDRIFFVR